MVKLWRWAGVILIYLFLEWVYNQHLLEVLSYTHITTESFQKTEVFGKVIASLGINLFLIKIFQYRFRFF